MRVVGRPSEVVVERTTPVKRLPVVSIAELRVCVNVLSPLAAVLKVAPVRMVELATVLTASPRLLALTSLDPVRVLVYVWPSLSVKVLAMAGPTAAVLPLERDVSTAGKPSAEPDGRLEADVCSVSGCVG